MTTMLLGTPDGVVRIQVDGDLGRADGVLEAPGVTTVALDPHNAEMAYAATKSGRFYRSHDRGRTWAGGGDGIGHDCLTSLVVSRSERRGDVGTVYVGSAPSALYRSDDAGATFKELTALQDVPSRPRWSFPPLPHTHHVWSLETDANAPGRVLVGIELGGIIRSDDGGETFLDWVPTQDPDPHQIRTHPRAPGRIYEGGGATYCESRDSGVSWQREIDPFPDEIRYFYSLAVDPGDPDTIVISAARDPFTGHTAVPGVTAWSTLYRKTADRDWHELTIDHGLPAREGTRMGWLETDQTTPGQLFYTTITGDVYRSTDAGDRWEKLLFAWPEGVTRKVTRTAISPA